MKRGSVARCYLFALSQSEIISGQSEKINIGDVSLKSVALLVQGEADFILLSGLAIALAAEKESELKRHVETRQLGGFIELHGGDVVDSVKAFLDKIGNFLKTGGAGVIEIQRTASDEP